MGQTSSFLLWGNVQLLRPLTDMKTVLLYIAVLVNARHPYNSISVSLGKGTPKVNSPQENAPENIGPIKERTA
jgi:hypothetical protein